MLWLYIIFNKVHIYKKPTPTVLSPQNITLPSHETENRIIFSSDSCQMVGTQQHGEHGTLRGEMFTIVQHRHHLNLSIEIAKLNLALRSTCSIVVLRNPIVASQCEDTTFLFCVTMPHICSDTRYVHPTISHLSSSLYEVPSIQTLLLS